MKCYTKSKNVEQFYFQTTERKKYKNLYLCKKDLNIWTIVAKKKLKQNIIYLTQRKMILISKNLQILLHK